MPKYYAGLLPIPFEIVQVTSENATIETFTEIFRKRNSATICVSFTGFDENCLGYIFNIKKSKNQFELLNITLQSELRVTSLEKLLDVIHHVSGIRFVNGVHSAFHNSRNNIGTFINHIY